MIAPSTLCPVCGYDLGFPAWTGDSPSDAICPSCGIQFGYNDHAGGDPGRRPAAWAEWRRRWIQDGMRWWRQSGPPPPGWDPVERLRAIGVDPAAP